MLESSTSSHSSDVFSFVMGAVFLTSPIIPRSANLQKEEEETSFPSASLHSLWFRSFVGIPSWVSPSVSSNITSGHIRSVQGWDDIDRSGGDIMVEQSSL